MRRDTHFAAGSEHIVQNAFGTNGASIASSEHKTDDLGQLKKLVCSLTEKIVSAGIGMREEVLLSVVPALLDGLLPFDDDADGLRVDSELRDSGTCTPVGGVSQGSGSATGQDRMATATPSGASEVHNPTDNPPAAPQARSNGKSIELQEISQTQTRLEVVEEES